MDSQYRMAKEAFVAHGTGSSVPHVLLISVPSLLSLAVYAAAHTRRHSPPSFLFSYAVLVLPLLLAITVAALRPWPLVAVLATALPLLLLFPRYNSGIPLPAHARLHAPSPRLPPLPALTTYRASMMLLTVLSILAVDFPLFPRALEKCENYGVSMMDMGVGAFVFSQGLVSATPLLVSPAHLRAPLRLKLFHAARRAAPVALLGLLRVLLVKATGYPEHESEYGRHWNFFLTLAATPVLQTALHPVFARMPAALVGVLLALAHQTALALGLEAYVMRAARGTSLVSLNKEGLVSLPGYLAVHILGLATGLAALALKSPLHSSTVVNSTVKPDDDDSDDDSEKHEAPRDTVRTAMELCAYAAMWWVLLGAVLLLGLSGPGVSRRLANLGYVLWVAAYNTSFLLAYLVVLDIGFFSGITSKDNPPRLFVAINKHGLALFLLANVLTGGVNFAMRTLETRNSVALGVLMMYSMVVTGVAWVWGV